MKYSAKINDQVNLDQKKSTTYRVKQEIQYGDRDQNINSGFSNLKDLFRRYKEQYPNANVSVEVDKDGRFFRAFLSNFEAISAQYQNISVCGLDAALIRIPIYKPKH